MTRDVIRERHLGITREGATQTPRSEGDQAIVEGWPLYRTERGQTAFNDTMATLKATDAAAPGPAAFKGCADLKCNIALPAIDREGYLQPGRMWLSPGAYILFVKSPRPRDGRRRMMRGMRYFVFHEFHNRTRNTDMYDTISSHSGAVFVPFYMGKTGTDARGHKYVVIVQVAPYDVVSIHASNFGSNGPGIEVAKNVNEALEPLQAHAGVLIAAIVRQAAPHLRVVNHRGTEGQAMLRAYEQWATRTSGGAPATLPFVAALPQRVAGAASRLDEVITRPGATPRLAVAARGLASMAGLTPPRPALIEPVTPVTSLASRDVRGRVVAPARLPTPMSGGGVVR